MANVIDSVMATAKVTNAAVTGSAGTFNDTNASESQEIYRVAVTTDAYLTFDGSTATAANGEFWPAGNVEYVKIPKGGSVSYIRASADGRITFSRQA